MKKRTFLCILAVVCLLFSCAGAGGWSIPNNHQNNQNNNSGSTFAGISVKLTDDLATRSGPSTSYTGCGSYKMKGQTVRALARSYDNGGVLWIEIEFSYGGGYRRAWTGAKRLDISRNQLSRLPEEDFNSWIGYGTLNMTIAPRFGPGDIYASYGDRNFSRNDQVAVIRLQNGYYLVECYHTDGNILRSWIPEYSVDLN